MSRRPPITTRTDTRFPYPTRFRSGIQFQVAAGGGVHRDRAVARFDRDRGQVRQALLLGFLDVAEQGARGGDRQRPLVDAERGQVVQVEELQQLPAPAVGVEQPRRAPPRAAPGAEEHTYELT